MLDSRVILIADGIPNSVPRPVAAVRNLSYEIVTAEDALFVQSLALRHRPAVVILGPRLPAGGALAALTRLRASVHTASIQVIAVALPGTDKQALLSAGVDLCLEPPVSEAELLSALAKYPGFSRLAKEAPPSIIRSPERLAALSQTRLLDPIGDESLDAITRLAAKTLVVPAVTVTLVDATRQFFKSQHGLSCPLSETRETPLSHSFCQWVVTSREELIVSDARDHPVLCLNGAVADFEVVAYAGVPLSTPTGHTIGAFCAIDSKPRSWTDDELATLRDFGQIVNGCVALDSFRTGELTPDAHERSLAVVAVAASRGFLGSSRLLHRDSPRISDGGRLELPRVKLKRGYRPTRRACFSLRRAIRPPSLSRARPSSDFAE